MATTYAGRCQSKMAGSPLQDLLVIIVTMTASRSLRPYRPQMSDTKWQSIAPYVHDVVARTEPQITYSEAQLYPAVTRLVEFAKDNYVPLEDDAVFDPYTIDRFITHHFAAYNRASRNTMRARLRRVSEALLGEDARGQFQALGKAEASRPYAVKEVAAFESWSGWQTSPERRTSAGALLALGLGAGLTGAEIIALKMNDVDLSTMTVHVMGSNRRDVPVFPDWHAPLNARWSVVGSGGWVFREGQRGGNVNLITDFVSRKPAEVPLQARRMRATWLVRHLDAGTPVKQLLRISGIQSAEAFDRFLPFARD